MDFIITIVAIVFIVIAILNKSKKNNSTNNTKRPAPAKRPNPTVNQRSTSASRQVSVKTTVNKPNIVEKRREAVRTEINRTMLLEDRNNDWLARQLRDEHKAFKDTKDMFDLKIEHSSHCDAEYIKQFHQKTCSANKVDTASGK